MQSKQYVPKSGEDVLLDPDKMKITSRFSVVNEGSEHFDDLVAALGERRKGRPIMNVLQWFCC